MKPFVVIASLILSQVVLQRCSMANAEMTPSEYVQWVENAENGLRTSKTIGGYTFDLQYKPNEYVVLRENSVAMPSAEEMNAETASIADMQYYTLHITSESGLDLLNGESVSAGDYSSRLIYFSSGMQNDLCLVEDGDTLPCQLFHFERTFGVDARSTFLLGFPNGKSSGSSRTFVFDDHELGTGTIMLGIDAADVQNIPSLKLY